MKEGKVRPFIEKYYPEYYSWNEYLVDKCAPIRSNKEEWGILGNLYPATLVVDGVKFASSEQLFQMMKFTDKETIQSLYEAKGMTPKMKAKKLENEGFRRSDWGQIIVDCMKFCLQTKYDQCEDFRTTLHKTTGLYIVEDETKRKISRNGNIRPADTWGVVSDGNKFIGSNLLGRLLMELRDNGKLDYHLPSDILGFLQYFTPVSLQLDHEEIYDPCRQNIWCFKHVDDIVEGTLLNLCNMTSCYPFEVNGIKWRSSEELYLCGEFSHDTPDHRAIQEKLRAARSPYAAKRFVKGKHRREVREDFPEFRTQWMLWVVWQKCRGNKDFEEKLLSLSDDVILVEETTTDTGGSGRIWGCSNRDLVNARKNLEQELKEKNSHLKRKDLKLLLNVELNKVRNIGLFKGQNNIGKILMICRRCLQSGTEPPIDYSLLESKNIYLLGEKLKFER